MIPALILKSINPFKRIEMQLGFTHTLQIIYLLKNKERCNMRHFFFFLPLCFHSASLKPLMDFVVFWAVWLNKWAGQDDAWSKIVFGDTWESVLRKKGSRSCLVRLFLSVLKQTGTPDQCLWLLMLRLHLDLFSRWPDLPPVSFLQFPKSLFVIYKISTLQIPFMDFTCVFSFRTILLGGETLVVCLHRGAALFFTLTLCAHPASVTQWCLHCPLCKGKSYDGFH